MNILLTGASGFLGKIILNQLNGNISTLGRTPLGNKHIQCDLNSIPRLENKFDIVIHNAGKAHSIPKNEEAKNEFYNINYEGTKNLLFALSQNPPKVFIFISTIAVYGLETGHNITESMDTDPSSIYGLSKLKAEQEIQKWCDKNKVKYFILRLPLVVGRNPPGNLGAIKKAIGKGYYIKIKNNSARKSMVLAEDVAELIRNLPTYPYGIYNLTDTIHPTFADVENAIEHRLKKKSLSLNTSIVKLLAKVGDFLNVIRLPSPLNTSKLDKITSTLTFDDTKAKRELNWNPKPVIPFIRENL